jgi:hypothetical protein
MATPSHETAASPDGLVSARPMTQLPLSDEALSQAIEQIAATSGASAK